MGATVASHRVTKLEGTAAGDRDGDRPDVARHRVRSSGRDAARGDAAARRGDVATGSHLGARARRTRSRRTARFPARTSRRSSKAGRGGRRRPDLPRPGLPGASRGVPRGRARCAPRSGAASRWTSRSRRRTGICRRQTTAPSPPPRSPYSPPVDAPPLPDVAAAESSAPSAGAAQPVAAVPYSPPVEPYELMKAVPPPTNGDDDTGKTRFKRARRRTTGSRTARRTATANGNGERQDRRVAVRASAASRPRRATGRTCGRPRARRRRSSKPHATCSAIDASFPPEIRAMHGVEAVRLGEAEQLVEQPPPDAAALVRVEQVDGVLHRPRVGGPGPERRERPEAHDAARDIGAGGGVDRDERRVTARVLVDPGDLLVERAGHEVEERGRLGDVVVVDGPDALGVAALGEADHHVGCGLGQGRAHSRKVARRPALLSLTVRPRRFGGLAPLAQSAEHFHGKEGVYGSSP